MKSCDTIYYKFAYEQWLRDGGNRPVDQPRDPMIRMAQAFGLGSRTGIDLPSERRGNIADREYKQEYWEATRENRCKGAENPELPAEQHARDRDTLVSIYSEAADDDQRRRPRCLRRVDHAAERSDADREEVRSHVEPRLFLRCDPGDVLLDARRRDHLADREERDSGEHERGA